MELFTEDDLILLEKEIERIKNDPAAQKRIAKKLEQTIEYLAELNTKRRIGPEIWHKQITI